MKIGTPTADVFLKEEDLVVIKYKQGARVGLEEMKAIHEAEQKITSKKHLALLDARGFIIVSDEARKYGASDKPGQYRKAAALLVNTMGVRMMGNFYLTFNKPKVLTKMFTQEKKAMDWLRRLKVP